MRSADRAAIGEYLIRPNNERDYFRSRLLKDLPRTRPAIVVDAIRDGYFFNNDPEYDPKTSNLRSFPALYDIVARDFVQVAGGERCAAIYLRRDKADALLAAEIPLASSIPAFEDGSMTEQCVDDWWSPDRPDATAELSVDPPAPVGELWILASRGGIDWRPGEVPGDARDRGTTQVRIKFISPTGSQSDQVVQLHNYPNWTVVLAADSGPVARIEIQSLGYVGKGPALAGVKAFKAGW